MSRGVVLPYWADRPPAETFDVAAAAAEHGYDELWLGEMATFDSFALAAALAGRIAMPMTVGPLAVGVRDPVGMAMGIASVAAVSSRPVGLAVGTSTPVVVAGWHGREWEPSATRLRETVEATRLILSGGKAVYEGTRVTVRGFRLRFEPTPCPITVAAFGPASIRAAARVADRMVVNLVTPALAASLAGALADAARRADRPAPPLAAWIVAAVDPTEETYRQLAGAFVAYLAAPGYGEMFIAAGFDDIVRRARAGAHPRELAASIPIDLIHAVAAIGDAASVAKRLDEYVDAGVTDIAVVPATAADPGAARTLRALRPRPEL